jgi:kynureninase
MEFENSLAYARHLDEQDDLKNFRKEFVIPTHNGNEAVYFLGNSLGLQPIRTKAYIDQVLVQWSNFGVEGFFMGEQPWLQYHDQLIGPMSRIVGALPSEVVIMNQLTVNLHLMLVSFYQPNEKRKKIICEAKAFPSDQYVLETHIKQRGFDPVEIIVEVNPREGEYTIHQDDIIQAINDHRDELALVFWGGVNYYTGQVFDMKGITAAAQEAGAKVGFDLAHAAGNITLQLHDWNVDFACWCSYKYLNSGPGAIAGAFIHQRYHTDSTLPRFAGWWGYKKETQFLMQKGFDPQPDASGWQLSTPSPLLYAAHKASLEIFSQAGMQKLCAKGQRLSDYLLYLLKDLNAVYKNEFLHILTPVNQNEKGCQVSMLMLKHGKKVFDHLASNGVFADWREPDVIRVAAVPLYNTFEEVWQFVRIMDDTFKTFS